jgi:hypothetical protein
MVKCGVLSEVRTEFLNIIYTSFGFKVFKVWYHFEINKYNCINKTANTYDMNRLYTNVKF